MAKQIEWTDGRYGYSSAKISRLSLVLKWNHDDLGEYYEVRFAGMRVNKRFRDEDEAKKAAIAFAKRIVAQSYKVLF